jgi:hypothetical protein
LKLDGKSAVLIEDFHGFPVLGGDHFLPDATQHSSCPFFYYYLVCEAIGTAATPGLLCHPRVIVKMIVEKQIEYRLAGETEVLG